MATVTPLEHLSPFQATVLCTTHLPCSHCAQGALQRKVLFLFIEKNPSRFPLQFSFVPEGGARCTSAELAAAAAAFLGSYGAQEACRAAEPRCRSTNSIRGTSAASGELDFEAHLPAHVNQN